RRLDEDCGALRIRPGREGRSQGVAGARRNIRAPTRHLPGALPSLRVCIGCLSDRHRAGVGRGHHRHDGPGLRRHRSRRGRARLHAPRIFQPAVPALAALDLAAAGAVKRAPALRHIWMARLSTANAASFTASVNVGWGWQVRAISSDAAPNSMATAASAIMLPASAPTMWTPSTRSVLASARIFTKPSVCRFTFARPLAVKGNLPVLLAMPASFNSSSLFPTEAISG